MTGTATISVVLSRLSTGTDQPRVNERARGGEGGA